MEKEIIDTLKEVMNELQGLKLDINKRFDSLKHKFKKIHSF